MYKIDVHTKEREQFYDITGRVQQIADMYASPDSKQCLVFIPHTTAGLTINENADPAVAADILMSLDQLVSKKAPYRHLEGNSPAHIKASLLGTSLIIVIQDRHLRLGTWQGIFLVEFDGPRKREVWISFS